MRLARDAQASIYGRIDLDAATLMGRRDAFLRAALDRASQSSPR
jgi:hypothetical protein